MTKSREPDNALAQPNHPVLDRDPGLRAAAVRSGLDCLDHQWKGVNAMYRFRCDRGHVFLRTLQTFSRVSNAKCPTCAVEAHMNQLRTLADRNGVKCLETRWLGWDAAHRFQCAQGHIWSRRGNRALSGIDCPHCGKASGYDRRRAESLARLHQIAAERGGVCLNTSYQANKPYRFRCARGHEWEAQGHEVKRRTWCPECARLRKVEGYRHQDGLERLRQKAAERGGQCLAEAYLGVGSRYRFRCAKGHEWETLGRRMLRGGWCLICAYDKKRLSIEDAHASAKARGGQCLSTSYIRVIDKLHWLCHRGHSWHAQYANIRAGHWCPECASMDRVTNPKSNAWKRYKAVPFAMDALLFGDRAEE
ncbi:hypothetical protein [Pseudomonas sp. MF4836]|uniref:hypothetical protein n=1 Tax=Pseudomonas sp. MF4836 TaxID=1960827 RepID=UPI00128FDF9F|nr:hypothetical protein [Pseudomonas sp. MF4836]